MFEAGLKFGLGLAAAVAVLWVGGWVLVLVLIGFGSKRGQ